MNNGYVWTDDGDYLEAFCCTLYQNPPDPASGTFVNTELGGRVVITWQNQRGTNGGGGGR